MADRFKRRKAESIAALGGKCSKCGSVDGLQFDHKDRSAKTFEISKIWMHSKEKLTEELAKCQLLCGECHYAKTCEDLGWTPRPKSERRNWKKVKTGA